MPHKMRAEVAQPLLRLKDNPILAVHQLGFLILRKMKLIKEH